MSVILLAATLFGTAGRFDIIEFWAYIAIVAAVSALSLAILDTKSECDPVAVA